MLRKRGEHLVLLIRIEPLRHSQRARNRPDFLRIDADVSVLRDSDDDEVSRMSRIELETDVIRPGQRRLSHRDDPKADVTRRPTDVVGKQLSLHRARYDELVHGLILEQRSYSLLFAR
jgi:hypothetical protein